MKVIKIDLPNDVKDNEIKIFPLSDVHIEDAGHNRKALLKWRDEVLSEENNYVILNGDLVNNATRDSVSDVYSAETTPNEAINTLVEFLTPIKDRILSIVSGNHENRSYKTAGIDITERIARELNIVDKYSPNACTIFLSFGKSLNRDCRKQPYCIFHRHGNAGGKKVGSKANQLEEMLNVIDADLFLLSHTHQAISFKKSFYRCDYKNKKLTATEKVFVNTNAWLDYKGYSVSHGYHPPSLKHPVITLKGNTKEIEVKI